MNLPCSYCNEGEIGFQLLHAMRQFETMLSQSLLPVIRATAIIFGEFCTLIGEIEIDTQYNKCFGTTSEPFLT